MTQAHTPTTRTPNRDITASPLSVFSAITNESSFSVLPPLRNTKASTIKTIRSSNHNYQRSPNSNSKSNSPLSSTKSTPSDPRICTCYKTNPSSPCLGLTPGLPFINNLCIPTYSAMPSTLVSSNLSIANSISSKTTKTNYSKKRDGVHDDINGHVRRMGWGFCTNPKKRGNGNAGLLAPLDSNSISTPNYDHDQIMAMLKTNRVLPWQATTCPSAIEYNLSSTLLNSLINERKLVNTIRNSGNEQWKNVVEGEENRLENWCESMRSNSDSDMVVECERVKSFEDYINDVAGGFNDFDYTDSVEGKVELFKLFWEFAKASDNDDDPSKHQDQQKHHQINQKTPPDIQLHSSNLSTLSMLLWKHKYTTVAIQAAVLARLNASCSVEDETSSILYEDELQRINDVNQTENLRVTQFAADTKYTLSDTHNSIISLLTSTSTGITNGIDHEDAKKSSLYYTSAFKARFKQLYAKVGIQLQLSESDAKNDVKSRSVNVLENWRNNCINLRESWKISEVRRINSDWINEQSRVSENEMSHINSLNESYTQACRTIEQLNTGEISNVDSLNLEWMRITTDFEKAKLELEESLLGYTDILIVKEEEINFECEAFSKGEKEVFDDELQVEYKRVTVCEEDERIRMSEFAKAQLVVFNDVSERSCNVWRRAFEAFEVMTFDNISNGEYFKNITNEFEGMCHTESARINDVYNDELSRIQNFNSTHSNTHTSNLKDMDDTSKNRSHTFIQTLNIHNENMQKWSEEITITLQPLLKSWSDVQFNICHSFLVQLFGNVCVDDANVLDDVSVLNVEDCNTFKSEMEKKLSLSQLTRNLSINVSSLKQTPLNTFRVKTTLLLSNTKSNVIQNAFTTQTQTRNLRINDFHQELNDRLDSKCSAIKDLINERSDTLHISSLNKTLTSTQTNSNSLSTFEMYTSSIGDVTALIIESVNDVTKMVKGWKVDTIDVYVKGCKLDIKDVIEDDDVDNRDGLRVFKDEVDGIRRSVLEDIKSLYASISSNRSDNNNNNNNNNAEQQQEDDEEEKEEHNQIEQTKEKSIQTLHKNYTKTQKRSSYTLESLTEQVTQTWNHINELRSDGAGAEADGGESINQLNVLLNTVNVELDNVIDVNIVNSFVNEVNKIDDEVIKSYEKISKRKDDKRKIGLDENKKRIVDLEGSVGGNIDHVKSLLSKYVNMKNERWKGKRIKANDMCKIQMRKIDGLRVVLNGDVEDMIGSAKSGLNDELEGVLNKLSTATNNGNDDNLLQTRLKMLKALVSTCNETLDKFNKHSCGVSLKFCEDGVAELKVAINNDGDNNSGDGAEREEDVYVNDLVDKINEFKKGQHKLYKSNNKSKSPSSPTKQSSSSSSMKDKPTKKYLKNLESVNQAIIKEYNGLLSTVKDYIRVCEE